MVKHRFKSLITRLLVLALFIGLMILWQRYRQQPAIEVVLPPMSSPIPSTTLKSESSDGKMVFGLSSEPVGDKNVWTLTNNDEFIWSKRLKKQVSLRLPFNAVSPDNKFLFLEQTGLSSLFYLVLTVKGEEKIEFANKFDENYEGLVIAEATGWAAPDLIIVNTNKKDGSLGPSFWFDLNTESFIRLVNRFN